MSPAAPEVRQVAEAIHRAFALDDLSLPTAFRPAHLAVALIDAVFASGLKPGEAPEPAAERYCRRFGLSRTLDEQRDGDGAHEAEEETLGRVVERYAALGVRGMADKAFGSRRHFPGTRRTRSECVLRAVRALVRIEVERLCDVTARRHAAIEAALEAAPWAGAETGRLLLMYTGGDAFVWGDAPVRAFVAGALGRRSVAATRAVGLVRAAAYELVLAPRFVDHAIWRAATSAGGVPGSEPWPR